MTSAPATGCCCCNCCSNASAGGQLEQPSEVNNSTTTGLRPASTAEACAFVLAAKGKYTASSAKVSAIAAAEKCLMVFISSCKWMPVQLESYTSQTSN